MGSLKIEEVVSLTEKINLRSYCLID